MSNYEAGLFAVELLAACRAQLPDARHVNARDAGEKVTVCLYRFKRLFDAAMRQVLDEVAQPPQAAPQPRVYR